MQCCYRHTYGSHHYNKTEAMCALTTKVVGFKAVFILPQIHPKFAAGLVFMQKSLPWLFAHTLHFFSMNYHREK